MRNLAPYQITRLRISLLVHCLMLYQRTVYIAHEVLPNDFLKHAQYRQIRYDGKNIPCQTGFNLMVQDYCYNYSVLFSKGIIMFKNKIHNEFQFIQFLLHFKIFYDNRNKVFMSRIFFLQFSLKYPSQNFLLTVYPEIKKKKFYPKK